MQATPGRSVVVVSGLSLPLQPAEDTLSASAQRLLAALHVPVKVRLLFMLTLDCFCLSFMLREGIAVAAAYLVPLTVSVHRPRQECLPGNHLQIAWDVWNSTFLMNFLVSFMAPVILRTCLEK